MLLSIFFRQREHSDIDGEPQVESPRIDSQGNVDYWPSGFFDQFDNDMLYFLSGELNGPSPQ